MSDSETEEEPRPKSVRYDWPAYLTFLNRTDYPIDIAWIDYNGNLVRYRKELTGGGVCHQNTFVTHPWIAWHSRTLERVSLGGNNVFLPQPWQGEQHRTIVYIDRPVKSLLKLCLQSVKNVLKGNVEELEIPKILQEQLKKRRRVDFVDFVNRSRR